MRCKVDTTINFDSDKKMDSMNEVVPMREIWEMIVISREDIVDNTPSLLLGAQISLIYMKCLGKKNMWFTL